MASGIWRPHSSRKWDVVETRFAVSPSVGASERILPSPPVFCASLLAPLPVGRRPSFPRRYGEISNRSTQEIVADTLADLHGLEETLIGPVPRDAHERSVLWSLLKEDSTFVSSAVPRPATSPGIISVRRLRHKVPREARKAYERASKAVQSNELEKAVGELERTVTLDPDFEEAHSDLGHAIFSWAAFQTPSS
jgi:hypothetical protein